MREFYWDNSWLFGANFIPSNAINQLEMWQEDTFSKDVIERELGYAKSIGMNVMRVFLHDLLWEQDSKGLISRMETYLSVADKLGIKTMFVFFDDCWNDVFSLGKQPEPVELKHNSGWIKSPGTVAADDLSQRPRLEQYVKGILTHFANDRRIVAWDLYNEPGQRSSGYLAQRSGFSEVESLPLLLDVFRWAKEVSPSQPYTAGIWNWAESCKELNEAMIENSDIITFHVYGDKNATSYYYTKLKDIANSRPLVCTEYMARHTKSTFEEVLPFLKEKNIGAINWGLVSGKTQTIYPWDSWPTEDRYSMPFHDIFNKDGSFLVPEEEQFFNEHTVG